MRAEARKGEGAGEEELKPRENNSHCKLNGVTLSGNSVLSTIKTRVIYYEVPSCFYFVLFPHQTTEEPGSLKNMESAGRSRGTKEMVSLPQHQLGANQPHLSPGKQGGTQWATWQPENQGTGSLCRGKLDSA